MKKNEPAKYVVSIKSNRLLLRNIVPSDKDFVVNLWTNPAVTKYMGGPRDNNEIQPIVQENIDNPFKEEYDLWILEERTSHNLIGHCGLLKKSIEGQDEVEVIYVIDEIYWGNGYASEVSEMLLNYAFNEKKINSVVALIKPDNKISQKIAVKAGMKLEAEIARPGNTQMFLYRLGSKNK